MWWAEKDQWLIRILIGESLKGTERYYELVWAVIGIFESDYYQGRWRQKKVGEKCKWEGELICVGC